MVQPGVDGYVHHWAQGPRDQIRLYAPITYWEKQWDWQFCWFLETPNAIPGVTPERLASQVHYILNMHGFGWQRTGVYFSQVHDSAKAQVVLRFSDAAPSGWPDLPWGPGWAYYDSRIGKRVAQITSRRDHWDDQVGFAYLLNMELGGHCCFDMHDMYTGVHAPYTFGCMGGWDAARANFGMPSDMEIKSGYEWLQGQAIHVHDHGNVRVGPAELAMPAPHPIDDEYR